MWLQRSSSQRSPPAHRFRFAVSATHSPTQSVHKAVDAARVRMNVGRLTNKRDSTVLKEMLFDPPNGLVLTDRYVCVMFARPCLRRGPKVWAVHVSKMRESSDRTRCIRLLFVLVT